MVAGVADDPATAERRAREAAFIALAAVPVLALLCCVPGFGALAAMDANCGDEFSNECIDFSDPVFAVWPWVTGGVAAAALLAMRRIPYRSEGIRLLVGSLVVVPPVINALAAYGELTKTGLV
jgi:hypothetical protein